MNYKEEGNGGTQLQPSKKKEPPRMHPAQAPSQPTRQVPTLDFNLQTRDSRSESPDPFIREIDVSTHAEHQRQPSSEYEF